jgi:hypothetical protein
MNRTSLRFSKSYDFNPKDKKKFVQVDPQQSFISLHVNLVGSDLSQTTDDASPSSSPLDIMKFLGR